MLFYRAALPLSRQTLTFVSGLVRTHRREIGSPWRALNPGQQALLVLVHLRKGEPFAEVGAEFGVSTTTCWRYVNEAVELLAARAPKLRAALAKAQREKMAYVIIDGTLIPIDRIAVDRPFYSGKHQRHGVNLQVIASPDGTILWVSGELPGSTHDTAAARIWQILAALEQAGLTALGDKGYHGYDQTRQRMITPYKGKNKPQLQTDANRAHARLRGPGERANVQLKLVDRLGIHTTLHKLRHYSATELIRAGVDVRTVAGRLGHADGGTTLVYYARGLGRLINVPAAFSCAGYPCQFRHRQICRLSTMRNLRARTW